MTSPRYVFRAVTLQQALLSTAFAKPERERPVHSCADIKAAVAALDDAVANLREQWPPDVAPIMARLADDVAAATDLLRAQGGSESESESECECDQAAWQMRARWSEIVVPQIKAIRLQLDAIEVADDVIHL